MSTATEVKPTEKIIVTKSYELIEEGGVQGVNIYIFENTKPKETIHSFDSKLINLMVSVSRVIVQAPVIHKDLKKAN